MKKTIVIFLLALPLGMQAMEKENTKETPLTCFQQKANVLKIALYESIIAEREEWATLCTLFENEIMNKESEKGKNITLFQSELASMRTRNEEELTAARNALAKLKEKNNNVEKK